jgi:DNA-binding HxlR family transcriptional regulator
MEHVENRWTETILLVSLILRNRFNELKNKARNNVEQDVSTQQ